MSEKEPSVIRAHSRFSQAALHTRPLVKKALCVVERRGVLLVQIAKDGDERAIVKFICVDNREGQAPVEAGKFYEFRLSGQFVNATVNNDKVRHHNDNMNNIPVAINVRERVGKTISFLSKRKEKSGPARL